PPGPLRKLKFSNRLNNIETFEGSYELIAVNACFLLGLFVDKSKRSLNF
ncbi:MAG: hypothetical protein ACI8Z1_004003, partial [Candidatus Azotimanducaceae bacterium]